MPLTEEGGDEVAQRKRTMSVTTSLVLNFCLRCFSVQSGHPEPGSVGCNVGRIGQRADWKVWGQTSERAKNK